MASLRERTQKLKCVILIPERPNDAPNLRLVSLAGYRDKTGVKYGQASAQWLQAYGSMPRQLNQSAQFHSCAARYSPGVVAKAYRPVAA